MTEPLSDSTLSITVTVEKFHGDCAALETERGDLFRWPLSELPEGIAVGVEVVERGLRPGGIVAVVVYAVTDVGRTGEGEGVSVVAFVAIREVVTVAIDARAAGQAREVIGPVFALLPQALPDHPVFPSIPGQLRWFAVMNVGHLKVVADLAARGVQAGQVDL